MKLMNGSLSTLLLAALTISGAHASVLGYRGPLVSDATGNWKEYRTADEEDLLSDAGDDASCRARTTSNLRQLFFEHFRYYVDHSKNAIGETEIARFAKVLGMAPYESSGASAAVTDMRYRGSNETLRYFRGDNPTSHPGEPGLHSSIGSINKLMKLTTIKFDRQTNFGLLQMSADRLAMNESGDLAEKMITDMRTLYQSHPEEVIERCGTRHMYKDGEEAIRTAFDKMQTCTVGYTTKEKVQCFGRWASLCPNYNISLALIATPRYFATKHKAPLCAKTFRKILKTGRADGGIKPAVKAVIPVAVPTPETPVISPVQTPSFQGFGESNKPIYDTIGLGSRGFGSRF